METDRKILVHLYRLTTGNSRDDNNLHLGSWFGVKTNDEGRVVELKLHNKVKGEKSVTKKQLLVHVYAFNRQYVSMFPTSFLDLMIELLSRRA